MLYTACWFGTGVRRNNYNSVLMNYAKFSNQRVDCAMTRHFLIIYESYHRPN